MNTLTAVTWTLDGIALTLAITCLRSVRNVRRELAAMNTAADTPTDWDLFDEGNRP